MSAVDRTPGRTSHSVKRGVGLARAFFLTDCDVVPAINFDISTNTYATTWTEMGIGCEACHGPGAAHVAVTSEWEKNPSAKPEDPTPAQLQIFSQNQATPRQVFDTCGHRGVVGILGIPMAPVFLLRMTLRELRAFSIQGPTVDSMRAALELLRARPEAGKVISNVVPLDGANQAFADLAGGSGEVKVLVEPGG